MSPSSSPFFCCAFFQAALWAFAVSTVRPRNRCPSWGSSCNNLHLLPEFLALCNPIIYSVRKIEFCARKCRKKVDFVDILTTTITSQWEQKLCDFVPSLNLKDSQRLQQSSPKSPRRVYSPGNHAKARSAPKFQRSCLCPIEEISDY